jgi:transcription initiation factor IIE alpha subunit
MNLLVGEKNRGYLCPACRMFHEDMEEVANHDGTCANCGEYYVMWAELKILNTFHARDDKNNRVRFQ